MVIIITDEDGGGYGLEITEPESEWVTLLTGKMLCDELTVVSLALSRGLIELMGVFGKNGQPVKKGGGNDEH